MWIRRDEPVMPLAVAGLLIVPVLAFPELIPAGSRWGLSTLLTLVALASSMVLLGEAPPSVRISIGLLSAALALSWIVHDDGSVRHFTGAGLGLLAMSAVAAWAGTTRTRLLHAGGAFGTGALVILVTGLVGAEVNTGKFIGALREIPPELFGWLPSKPLGLPGLEENGRVNANALGGTALLLLPACCGVALAAFKARGRLVLSIAIAAAVVALVALVATRSRTALAAALLTALVPVIVSLRHRKLFLTGLLVVVMAGGYWVATFGGESGLLVDSMQTRFEIWREALRRLADAPLLGIGINAFHEVPNASPGTPGHVAHAHNVFLQMALDMGVPGAIAYVVLNGSLLVIGARTARGGGVTGALAAGAALSLVGVHLFGLTDAIALGAKVGLFQWLSAGLILAATAVRRGEGQVPEPPGAPDPPAL